MRRGSGILLHPTSLPGPYGIGDFGSAAYQFADFMHAAGQRYWQVLPLGPPAKGNSPYSSLSAFAGNPLLISPQRLIERGYLEETDVSSGRRSCPSTIHYSQVRKNKNKLLRLAFTRFEETDEYRAFERTNACWLEPFAIFMARKIANQGAPWTRIQSEGKADLREVDFHKFVQFEFFREWLELKQYCNERGISVIGDLPFYVEHDSADVWAQPELFHLDENGNPSAVGGVPPDYFSAEGQLWGNPTYRWEKLRETGYQWWMDRFRMAVRLFEFVRLDHFRGFEASWEVQTGAANAVNGRWVKGPGTKLFEIAQKEIGELPFVAENLGTITSGVEDIRRQFAFPGMAVIQFGFGTDSTHRPHSFSQDTVAYTGTHDNDSVVGWWESPSNDSDLPNDAERRAERERALQYVGTNGQEINWAFIRAVMTSVANVAIFPLQDVLGFGSESRMNTPGLADGNWRWRYDESALSGELVRRLRKLTELSGR
jgi:4-alpha-glucanotransferase